MTDAERQRPQVAGESRLTAMTEAEIGQVSGAGVNRFVFTAMEITVGMILRSLR